MMTMRNVRNIQKRHISPKVKLSDILRRRKATFAQWVNDSGIQTYDQLVRHCDAMGIFAPSAEEFAAAFPKNEQICVPTEGIVSVVVLGAMMPFSPGINTRTPQ